MAAFTQGIRHPQPQSEDFSNSCGLDDAELGRSKSSIRLQLPSAMSAMKARTMAGKASTKMKDASKASTKGASKMASAFGRKFRLASSGAQHQALPDASPGGMQNVIGREEGTDVLDASMDDAPCDGDDQCQWEVCGEDTSSLLHAQYSPQSTPSTERPRSPECLDRDRSDYSSDCQKSAPGSDTHSQGTGSDSDAMGRSKARASQAPALKKDPETWDAKAFVGVRPLECQSIWDIPTSRVPKPAPPQPVQQTLRGSRSLPKISISLPDPNAKSLGSPVRLPERQRGRTGTVVCLAMSLCAAAVVGAMFLI